MEMRTTDMDEPFSFSLEEIGYGDTGRFGNTSCELKPLWMTEARELTQQQYPHW